MHMADALVSPAVGGALWAATGVTTVYCARRVREDLDESKIPLMGVAGAFVFAAQMLNFTIPGTGSSGHLGGGLLLAALLGPEAAFLVMASVLGVQALFFADGGLLALGANIFNLGFFPAFIAYPLVFRAITGTGPGAARLTLGSVAGALVGLQLGAFGVVLETVLSGVSELPFVSFVAVVLPIHAAIGLVEGFVTAGVLGFVHRAQPELLERTAGGHSTAGVPMRTVLVGLLIAAVLSGGVFALWASANPDGLEWSIAQVTGAEEIEGATDAVHESLAGVQEKTSLLPDYSLPAGESSAGTSLAGVVGAGIVLGVAAVVGYALKRRRSGSGTG